MDKNIAITVKKISKVYKLYNRPIDRLKEAINPFRTKYHKDFFALRDIDFEIVKGQRIGIIGTNGSGKSTLLKIITGILAPTNGSIKVNGKISALLELGAGFNPEYNGLENVYLNGTIMGYSKAEMDKKIGEIVSFAEIGEFINQPVKMYSSGMFARLAFSVAINVDPDILIVDEALSVGDMHFQDKSFTKMKSFKEKGKTILLVSHSLPSVRNFCDRAIWIQNGLMKMDNSADVVCDAYEDYIENQGEDKIQFKPVMNKANPNTKVWIKSVFVEKTEYKTDEDIYIDIELGFNEKVLHYGVGVIIHNSAGEVVTLYNTIRDDIEITAIYSKFRLAIKENDFLKGNYFISVSVSDNMAMFPYDREDYIGQFKIKHKKNKNGIPITDGFFRSKHTWIY